MYKLQIKKKSEDIFLQQRFTEYDCESGMSLFLNEMTLKNMSQSL